MKKLIKCGWLFDATSGDCLKNDMEILVDGNLIADIAPAGRLLCPDAEVIELTGKFVMPGLIDGHVHLQFNRETGGREIVNHMSVPEIALKSLAVAQIDLNAGFTTLRNMSAVGFTDVAVKRSIEQGFHKGPRLMVSGMPLGARAGNGDTTYRADISGGEIGYVVSGPYETRTAVRLCLKYGSDLIKVSAANSFLDYGDETGAPEMTPDEIAAAVEIAHMNHKTVAAHTYSAQSIENAVFAGVDTIEHCVWVDDRTLEEMARRGTYIVPTIIALHNCVINAERFGLSGHSLDNAKRALEHQGIQIAKARGLGVPIAFGTDAGTPFNPHGEQLLEFKLMTDRGLSPVEALLAATKVNARMLGLDRQIGTLESGKLADITAFDKNPLEDITAMQNCAFVMKDGEIFKEAFSQFSVT